MPFTKYLKYGAFFITSASLYFAAGYHLNRTDFYQLLLIIFPLFILYFLLVNGKKDKQQLNFLIAAGLFFRVLLLFMIPNLSDDFYRFIWDGRLFNAGINPFSALPSAIAENPEITASATDQYLYQNLNSPNYFTIYPPVLQYLFSLAAWAGGENIFNTVILLRIPILLAEAGTGILLIKVLKLKNLPVQNMLWYWLNPLVIIELTGNLHYEAIMIFFLAAFLYLLLRRKVYFSALPFALAVASKLLPLMLIPLVVRKTGYKKGLVFCALTGSLIIFLFMPFLDKTVLNIFSSIGLYFHSFEFNASLYNLTKWSAFLLTGKSLTVGPVLLLLAFILILRTSSKTGDLLQGVLFIFTTYLAFSGIVHPWYITTLVFAALFTNFGYPVLWSCLAILSYAAYMTPAYQENYWLLLIEYGLLGAVMLYEFQNDRLTKGIKKYKILNYKLFQKPN